MTRFERVQQILDESIGDPQVQIGVHQVFWRHILATNSPKRSPWSCRWSNSATERNPI